MEPGGITELSDSITVPAAWQLPVQRSAHDVIQPDLLVVLTGRKSIVDQDYVRGAPDLVVEILSPSSEERDRIVKAKRYATFGVREMWLVDPKAKTIEVLVNAGANGFGRHGLYVADDTVRSTIFPALGLPVAPIFRPI